MLLRSDRDRLLEKLNRYEQDKVINHYNQIEYGNGGLAFKN